MSKNSIWDTRFTPPKITLDADVEAAFLAMDEWITIKGTHVELGENGEILHGMGGKFKNVHDVPRKTVGQRKGESTTDLYLRAADVFTKQDDYAAEKKLKDELNRAKEKADKLWLEHGVDQWGRDPMERYNHAAQMENEGHRGAMAEFERRERLRREGKTEDEIDKAAIERRREKERNNPINRREREREAFLEDQHTKGMALKQGFFNREISTENRQKLESERENRDWNKDLPLFVDKEFIANELRSGNMTWREANAAAKQTQARLEHPDSKGKETLNLTIYGDPHENPIEINVPKKYVASRSEVVAFRNANKS